jgi:hypothetical protein
MKELQWVSLANNCYGILLHIIATEFSCIFFFYVYSFLSITIILVFGMEGVAVMISLKRWQIVEDKRSQ